MQNNLSVQEYTSLETSTDTKYEYHDGAVFAMAGGTLNHGLICGNIFALDIQIDLKEVYQDIVF